ncbi:conserved hypothetical protein [Oleispira antarctica RB-8]|uniref:Uncharacterized protein n=1 Tax=Oleispira antarctica RB-8 TaxID=698738 RepID=R4YNJ7_OLEAN|nr:conserved hypothetical protein [Oleispira antarctica RB-8]
MTNEFQRYTKNLNEFEAILSYAELFVNSLVGQKPSCPNDVYGERIFVKLLCHAITLIKISPSKAIDNQRELWDISSCYAVSRALIETFDALHYIAIAKVCDDEKEFRLLFWKLHAEARRFDMLSKMGSKDPRVEETGKEVQILKFKLLGHEKIILCTDQLKSNIEKGTYQPYHLTQKQRNKEAGISHEYRDVATMHLSSHVHTHPFSVMQIVDFKAGSPECVGLMGIAIQYSTAFLAKAVHGMLQLFNSGAPVMDKETEDVYLLWLKVSENGIKKNY